MYSTSLGNSVMISTSCSRGRQKLRFQMSLKVRTARDRGALRGAPGKRGPQPSPTALSPSRGGMRRIPRCPQSMRRCAAATRRPGAPSPPAASPPRSAGRQGAGAQPGVQASCRPLPRRFPPVSARRFRSPGAEPRRAVP